MPTSHAASADVAEQVMPETPSRYFVSYAHQHGFGSCEITLASPVRGHQDVQVICDLLRRTSGVLQPVVLFFTLLPSAPVPAPGL